MTIAATFEALGEPNRRQIVAFLAVGEAPVKEIAGEFDISVAAVSQHLKVLREAGLVSVRAQANQRIYALRREGYLEAAAWLGRMGAKPSAS